ncbi:MAG: OadG family protein [Eubacteriales bacterium]|nr:OadG family protein [Eubacteriales bacterium]
MNELLFGLSVMAIGLLVVFAGLVLLIYCIKLITLFSNGTGKKQQTAVLESNVVEVEESAPVLELDPGVTPETVAAITAAIAAIWQEDTGFIVRRVRRVRNAAAWNLAGREEQVYSRL